MLGYAALSLARHQMAALLRVEELRFPVHFLMRTQMLNCDDFRLIVEGAGAEQLLKADDDGYKPFHYLMHERQDRSVSGQGSARVASSSASIRMPLGSSAKARPARSAETVASLLVGASARDPSFAQILLQQAADQLRALRYEPH